MSASSVKNSLALGHSSYDFGNTSSEAALLGSYGFAISKDWVGTVGLSVGLKNSDYATAVDSGITNNAVAKDHIALSFAPGIRIGNQGLLYGKVALHIMKVNYKASNDFDKTLSHQGAGVGFGYAYAASGKVELRAEYEAAEFNSQVTDSQGGINTTAKPKQTALTFGVLYKF